MFGWLFGKKEVEQAREDARKGFESVKKDMTSISDWIKHLDSERENQEKDISEIKEVLSTIQEEIEGLKNVVSIMNDLKPKAKNKQMFKTDQQVFNKQTGVFVDQTAVETGVQTPKLENFSVTERAILFILLNSDLKLSYDDLAAMLGKERSTIRGQINTIRSKSEGLIEEIIEKNGKKRVYIPEEIKEKMLKKAKVRVKKDKKGQKKEEKE